MGLWNALESIWEGVTAPLQEDNTADLERQVREDEERVRQLAPFTRTTETEAERVRRSLQDLARRPTLLDTSAARSALQRQFAEVGRASLRNAAERGLLHSRALDDVRLMAATQQAAANAQLRAQEEQYRRERLIGAGQELASVQRARQEIPESRLTTTPRTNLYYQEEVNIPERERIDRSIRQSQRIIDRLNARRPTEDQLRSAFRAAADDILKQASTALAEDARRRGFSEAYISSQLAELQQQALPVYAQLDQVALTLSGPDPEASRAVIGGLYTPEKIPFIEEQRVNPWTAVFGGVLGAGAGLLLGGPAGGILGYQLGASTGSLFG